MKSFVVSLSMVLSLSLGSVRGQVPLGSNAADPTTPAAGLGTPRATLGAPRPIASNVVPAPSAEILKPIARGQVGPAISPYRLTETPEKMPRAGIVEGDTLEPPAVNSTVPSKPTVPLPQLEAPLFAFPASAPPFISDPQRFRVSAEYLMWWSKGAYIPPLLTTGPAASNGFPGSPGVQSLLGGGTLDSSLRQGFRVGFLAYFDPCLRWGLDGNFFYLANAGSTSSISSNGDPLLARPFANVNDNIPYSELIAYPGVLAGGIRVSTGSKLWGADLNLRRNLAMWENSRLDFLIGYRHLKLDEYVSIDESSVGVPGSIANGLNAFANDRFQTSNSFNGGQIGLAYERTLGRWVLDARGKVAFGVTSQSIDVQGSQSFFNANGSTTIYQGGLLALPSNIGHFTDSSFSVVPELTLNLGYNITPRSRVFVGGNFLYWTNVVRAGNTIDTNLNINQIPNFTTSPNVGTLHPTVQFHDKDYWAMGLNFGFMFKW